jgi:hypothetical protein
VKFSDEEAKAPAHAEGTWKGTVIGAEVKPTSTKKQMIVLQWKTSEGKIRSYHTYVPEYPGLLVQPMVALGMDKDWVTAESTELEEVALECLKRTALLEVSHEMFKGNMTATVAAVNEIPDNGIKA